MRVTSWITEYFIRHNWLETDDAPWFRYGLEKRLSTTIIFIPFLGIAIYLSNFWIALSFFFSFFYLRKYINGFHAPTVQACFISTIVLEVVFLRFIFPYLSHHSILSLAIYLISLSIIVFLAPYKDPHLMLTEHEYQACRKTAMRRVWVVSVMIIFAWILNLQEVAHAMTTGIALAALLLCLAYIIKGRTSYEQAKEKGR